MNLHSWAKLLAKGFWLFLALLTIVVITLVTGVYLTWGFLEADMIELVTYLFYYGLFCLGSSMIVAGLDRYLCFPCRRCTTKKCLHWQIDCPKLAEYNLERNIHQQQPNY